MHDGEIGKNRAIVVMATYNEAQSIGKLLENITHQALIIDASSTDNTAEIARACGAVVVSCPLRTISDAYYDGLKMASKLGGIDYVIQMDAGMSHNSADIDRLLRVATSGGYDLVIGTRSFDWGWRAIISRMAAFLMRFYGINVPDATCGFRCWRILKLRRIIEKPFRAKYFAFQLEMLYRNGKDIATVPIEYKLTNSTFKPGMLIEALWIWATLGFSL